MSLLAIGWEPELRGLLTVVMAVVVVLMGSVYMILATNIGIAPVVLGDAGTA